LFPEVKSLHRFVNHFQHQINQPRQSFETMLSPRSHINSSIAFQYQINQPRQLFETTLRSNRSNNQQIAHNKSNIINNINSNINININTKNRLHRFVNHFQYQINQPRQSFETTLSSRSHIDSSIAFQYQINQPRQSFETTLRSNQSNNQQEQFQYQYQ
jgi:hypothetical protein